VKKFMVIGFVIAFMVASVLFWQHLKHPSDAKLVRQIAGTWTHGGLFTQTFSLDGSFSSVIGHSSALVTYQGTWLVKDHSLVLTVTNAQGTGNHRAEPVGSVDSSKIIHLDDHQFIYEIEGQTITLSR
jgi:hypothetical protein